MATKKYLMAIGWRALPMDGIPLSKLINLSLVLLLGPNICDKTIIKMTTPTANKNCNTIGKYDAGVALSKVSNMAVKEFPKLKMSATLTNLEIETHNYLDILNL